MSSYLLVVPFDRPGGAERVMKLTAIYLAKKNKVTVLLLKKRKYGFWDECESSCKIEYLNLEKEKWAYFYFLKWIKKNNSFTFIFTSHIHISAIVSIARRLKILKSKFHSARESTFVFNRFTGFKLAIFKLFYRLGYVNIDRHIFQTPEMKSNFLNIKPKYFRGEIKVIPNPIDFEALNSQSKVEVDLPPKCIISVGTLTRNKGQYILIDILEELDKDVYLVLLGDGEDRGKLKEQAIKLNVADRVIFKGMIKNVAKYCRAATVCAHSSWKEGFPNSLLEMMAVNSRIVSTISTKSVEEIPGLLTCLPGDKKALKNNIVRLLNESNEYDLKNRAIIDEYLKVHTIENFVKELFN